MADRAQRALERVAELCDRAENGGDVARDVRLPEPALRDARGSAAGRSAKLSRTHRAEPIFRAFATDGRLPATTRTRARPPAARSPGMRAGMVCRYRAAGTVDRSRGDVPVRGDA